MADADEYKLPDFVSFTSTYHHAPYDYISPRRPANSAAGQHVVVTGGGTGIGKAIAIAFAQASASSVSILGRRAAPLEAASKEIAAEGPKTKVYFEQADLTVAESTKSALKKLAEKIGDKPNVLVSSAGSNPLSLKILEYGADDFVEAFKLNTVSSLNAVQAFTAVSPPDAKIFNISSGMGHMQPVPTVFQYATTKATGMKLFDYLAAENPKLHVVQIQPGVIATDINKERGETGQDTIDLPGNFTVWLATKEAAFLKGRFVWANWDAEELISKAEELKKDPLLLKSYLGGVPM